MNPTSTTGIVLGLNSQWTAVLAIVQSIASIILAGLTAAYLVEVRKTRKISEDLVLETRQDRILNVRPVIIPISLLINDPHAQGGDECCMIFKMANIGNGPTFSLCMAMYSSETGKLLASSTHLVDYLTKDGDTDDNHFHINNENLGHLSYKEDRGEMRTRVSLKVDYEDIFGKKYTSERIFSLKKDDVKFSPVLGSFKLDATQD